MRRRPLATVIATSVALLALASCGDDAPPASVDTTSSTTTTTAADGPTTTVFFPRRQEALLTLEKGEEEEALGVLVKLEVFDDSRCPAFANCVTAGEVTFDVTLTLADGTRHRAELSGIWPPGFDDPAYGDHPSESFGDLSITAVDLDRGIASLVLRIDE